jgi:catechol 2,3-dioxygenase-like lactoylglutathione lyase family enzyme
MTELPALRGIHHLKFAVSDLARSLDFYERAFGARRIAEADHRTPDGFLFAYILEIPGLGTKLELRLNPEHAEKHRKFDPVTIAVDDRAALERWAAHFDALGIAHSPVLTAIQAWILVVDDPDHRRLRLYTNEMHGPELAPDNGSPWLQT